MEENNKLEEAKQKLHKEHRALYHWLLLPMAIITVISICVSGWLVYSQKTAAKQEYAPVELEPNAISMPAESNEEKLEAEGENGGAVAVSYNPEVQVTLSRGTVALFYQNPTRSLNNVVLSLVVIDKNGNEAEIAKSGMLEPGTMLERLALNKDVELPAGIYDGRFDLSFYDRKTGEKALLVNHAEGLTVVVN